MFLTSLQQVLLTIDSSQQKLESYRQLLNEQIQFNLKDLYLEIGGRSQQIGAKDLYQWLIGDGDGEGGDVAVTMIGIQAVIKGYNCCTSMKYVLGMSFIEFAGMFLSRENRLLAKLTIQRNSLGQIPTYLLTYAKKVLQLEISLHHHFLSFKKTHSSACQQWLKDNSLINEQTGEEQLDEKIIDRMCKEVEIESQGVKRYLRGGQRDGIRSSRVMALWTMKNCEKITEYLKKAAKMQGGLKTGTADPFIRPQFHDCLQRPKTLQILSHRELKSIQKHLQRLNSPSATNLPQKISHYRTHLEKQLLIFSESLTSILALEHEIQQQRIQLSLCPDFYPILFFESFNKDRERYVIPSVLREYLGGLGLEVEIGGVFLLFKRYSSRADGKLSFNQFCGIFDCWNVEYGHIERNREVRRLQDIDVQTIKCFLKLLKVLIRNQLKIQQLKTHLQSQISLRQIFSILDCDQDGQISMLDFRIAWKKYLLLELREERLGLLWYRMRVARGDMMGYEGFVAEMMPRCTWVGKKGVKKGKKDGK